MLGARRDFSPQSTPIQVPAKGLRADRRDSFHIRNRDCAICKQLTTFRTSFATRLCHLPQVSSIPCEISWSIISVVSISSSTQRARRFAGLFGRAWYGEETNSRSDLVGDFMDVGGNRVWFTIAMHQWVRDVEDLLLDSVETKHDSIDCFSGALASSTLREICGSWMFVRSDGHLNLADVRIRGVDEHQPIDQQVESWQHDEAGEPIAPVRRILQANGPQIDLQTGLVVNAPFTISALVKLLKMSRRTLEFLAQANEVVS